MAFTIKQQAIFRKMEAGAWSRHCAVTGADRKDRKAKDDWHREQLQECTGKRSTKELTSRDFDVRVMPYFETLAEAGVKWNIQALTADQRRLWWRLGNDFPAYRRTFNSAKDLEAEVLKWVNQAKMKNPKTGEPITALYQLSNAQMVSVTQMVMVNAKRYCKKGGDQ